MAILEGKFIKNVGQVATLQLTQKWFPCSTSMEGQILVSGPLNDDLKQLLLRQLHCKWPFSLSRLHPPSCLPTGSVEEKIGFDLRTSKYMLDCDGV